VYVDGQVMILLSCDTVLFCRWSLTFWTNTWPSSQLLNWTLRDNCRVV